MGARSPVAGNRVPIFNAEEGVMDLPQDPNTIAPTTVTAKYPLKRVAMYACFDMGFLISDLNERNLQGIK
jgi:hypothetical protein